MQLDNAQLKNSSPWYLSVSDNKFSAEQVAQTVFEHGFALVDGVFSPEECNSYLRGIDNVIRGTNDLLGADFVEKLRSHGQSEYRCPFYFDKIYLNFIDHPFTNELLSHLLPPRWIMRFQNIAVLEPVGKSAPANYAQQHFHQNFKRSVPGPDLLSTDILVTLEGAGSEHPMLNVVPGSHRLEYKPTTEWLLENEIPIYFDNGTLTILDSRTWHREVPNTSSASWRSLFQQFTRPWIKPHFDFVRLLGDQYLQSLPAELQQALGYFSRVPSTFAEFYAPPDRRLFRGDQW